MNSKATVAALSVAAVLALSACDSVTHGTIIGKQDIPASSYIYMQPVYSTRCTTSYVTTRSSSGAYSQRPVRSCSQVQTGAYPIVEHHAGCYQLTLKNSSGDTGTVCVSEAAWNSAKTDGSQQW